MVIFVGYLPVRRNNNRRMKYIMDHSITDKDGKIYWVDVCKGIGILFVVLGHIAG